MCWFNSNSEQSKKDEKSPASAIETERETTHLGYWCKNYSNTYLDYVIAKIYDFQSPVYSGKIHRRHRRRHEGGNCYSQWWIESESYSDAELVPEDELFQAVKQQYCWIDTKEEWSQIESPRFYYDIFVPKKIVSILTGKYSESFSLLLASKSLTSRELIQKALTLYEEGLSPDMRAYLLLVDNEKKRTG